jgi:hypothetical protein
MAADFSLRREVLVRLVLRLVPILVMVMAAMAGGPALAQNHPSSGHAADHRTVITVEAEGPLPGFDDKDVSRYIAGAMARARLVPWAFRALSSDQEMPDRVVWTFRYNPYAGGTIRPAGQMQSPEEKIFGIHREVTIEARLYLGGVYQTTSFGQVRMQGGPRDPDLAAEIATLTSTLMAYAGTSSAVLPGEHHSGRRHGDELMAVAMTSPRS